LSVGKTLAIANNFEDKLKMSEETSVLKGFLAITLLILIISWSSRSDDIQSVLLYLVPYAVAVAFPAKFTDLASGLVLGAVFIELPFTILFSFFGGIFPDPQVLALMRISSAILIVLALVGFVAHRRDGQQTGRFVGGAFTSVAYILAAAFALGRSTSHAAEIPADAKAALGPIHACLVLYTEKHAGQYPPSLKELGPHGSQCLDAALAAGNAERMKIKYHVQGGAKPGNYSLLMESSSWFKKSKSFYTDTTGIIHESFTSRPASSEDRVIGNASYILRSIANCLVQNGGTPYPRDVQHFREDLNLICSRHFMENGLQYHTYGTEVRYVPKVDHDIVKGFALTARPGNYGKDGVRSYFVDETSIVRGTSDNRAAGPDDPPVPACEYDSNPCHGV